MSTHPRRWISFLVAHLQVSLAVSHWVSSLVLVILSTTRLLLLWRCWRSVFSQSFPDRPLKWLVFFFTVEDSTDPARSQQAISQTLICKGAFCNVPYMAVHLEAGWSSCTFLERSRSVTSTKVKDVWTRYWTLPAELVQDQSLISVKGCGFGC